MCEKPRSLESIQQRSPVGITALASSEGAVDGALIGVQYPGQARLEVGNVEGGEESQGAQGKGRYWRQGLVLREEGGQVQDSSVTAKRDAEVDICSPDFITSFNKIVFNFAFADEFSDWELSLMQRHEAVQKFQGAWEGRRYCLWHCPHLQAQD